MQLMNSLTCKTLRRGGTRRLPSRVLPVLALAACGGAPEPEPRAPGDIARQTVSEQLSVPLSRVSVVSAQPRDFPDASLGCPQQGFSYAQVITPGHQVLVEADGRRFDVRVAGTRGRICQGKAIASQPDTTAGVFLDAEELVPMARNDLGRKIGVPAEELELRGVSTISIAPEAPCEQTESTAPQSEPALLVTLGHDGRTYTYHVNEGFTAACPDILNR